MFKNRWKTVADEKRLPGKNEKKNARRRPRHFRGSLEYFLSAVVENALIDFSPGLREFETSLTF